MKKITLLFVALFIFAETANASGNWNQSCKTDELDESVSCYASSPRVEDTRNRVSQKSWMGVGCNKDDLWAYYGFSLSPNILGDETHDGYSSRHYRTKWDSDKPKELRLNQTWGDRFLRIPIRQHAMTEGWVSNAKNKTAHLLEVPFYADGSALFKYSLAGSTKAINSALKKCGIKIGQYSQGKESAATAAANAIAAAKSAAAKDTAAKSAAAANDARLYYAAKEGQTKQVKSLLAKGANPNAKGQYGNTPLHTTIYYGFAGKHTEIVKILLAAGANPNAKGKYDSTPLHEAASSRHTILADMLLTAEANPNAITEGGWTPLHTAAWWGNAETVKLLLVAGANPNAKNKDGQTALDLAKEKERPKVVAILENLTNTE